MVLFSGLTALRSADVLDIMFADFHDKYEEFRQHLRDMQAKEFSLKQLGKYLCLRMFIPNSVFTTFCFISRVSYNFKLIFKYYATLK